MKRTSPECTVRLMPETNNLPPTVRRRLVTTSDAGSRLSPCIDQFANKQVAERGSRGAAPPWAAATQELVLLLPSKAELTVARH